MTSKDQLVDIYDPTAKAVFQRKNPSLQWEEFLEQPIERLGLSNRLVSTLWHKRIHRIWRLLCFSEKEFGGLDWIGETSVTQVREALASYGLRFSAHQPGRPGWHRIRAIQQKPLILYMSTERLAALTLAELLTIGCDSGYAYWAPLPDQAEPTVGSLTTFEQEELARRLTAGYDEPSHIPSAATELRAALLFAQPVE